MRCREEEKVIPLVRAPYPGKGAASQSDPTLCEVIVPSSKEEKQELSMWEGEL